MSFYGLFLSHILCLFSVCVFFVCVQYVVCVCEVKGQMANGMERF